MKEYLVMLLVFMVLMVTFGFFVSAFIISWLIVGRVVLIKKGVSTHDKGVLIYLFYLGWPYYSRNKNI